MQGLSRLIFMVLVFPGGSIEVEGSDGSVGAYSAGGNITIRNAKSWVRQMLLSGVLRLRVPLLQKVWIAILI